MSGRLVRLQRAGGPPDAGSEALTATHVTDRTESSSASTGRAVVKFGNPLPVYSHVTLRGDTGPWPSPAQHIPSSPQKNSTARHLNYVLPLMPFPCGRDFPRKTRERRRVLLHVGRASLVPALYHVAGDKMRSISVPCGIQH